MRLPRLAFGCGVGALVLVTLCGRGAALAGRETLSAEEIGRLEAGEILVTVEPVPGRSLPRMKAVGLVEAPPAAVWDVVSDCARYKDTMPSTIESEELYREREVTRCRVTLDMPFPFRDLVSETEAVSTIQHGELYRREWTHRGGDFSSNDGSWTLEPWDGGKQTLAVYDALMEPNVPIPGFILRAATRITLPGVIEALRTHSRP